MAQPSSIFGSRYVNEVGPDSDEERSAMLRERLQAIKAPPRPKLLGHAPESSEANAFPNGEESIAKMQQDKCRTLAQPRRESLELTAQVVKRQHDLRHHLADGGSVRSFASKFVAPEPVKPPDPVKSSAAPRKAKRQPAKSTRYPLFAVEGPAEGNIDDVDDDQLRLWLSRQPMPPSNPGKAASPGRSSPSSTPGWRKRLAALRREHKAALTTLAEECGTRPSPQRTSPAARSPGVRLPFNPTRPFAVTYSLHEEWDTRAAPRTPPPRTSDPPGLCRPVDTRPPRLPVYPGLLGNPLTDPSQVERLMLRQTEGINALIRTTFQALDSSSWGLSSPQLYTFLAHLTKQIGLPKPSKPEAHAAFKFWTSAEHVLVHHRVTLAQAKAEVRGRLEFWRWALLEGETDPPTPKASATRRKNSDHSDHSADADYEAEYSDHDGSDAESSHHSATGSNQAADEAEPEAPEGASDTDRSHHSDSEAHDSDRGSDGGTATSHESETEAETDAEATSASEQSESDAD